MRPGKFEAHYLLDHFHSINNNISLSVTDSNEFIRKWVLQS